MYHPQSPDARQLECLLSEVLRLSLAGGPACPQGHARDVEMWHGAVLYELDQVENMEPQVFSTVLEELGLDNAAGLRALLRVSAATAVAAALRHVLGQANPGTGALASLQLVLDEINLTHWWLGSQ